MTAAFKIEKGVPISTSPWSATTYPFREMEVGDSVLIPKAFYARAKTGHMAPRRAASVFGSRTGRKYVTRAVEGGIRIWRTV